MTVTIELRPYQSEAVDALFRYFERADGHPLVEMPTACHAPGTRVLDWRGRPVAVEDVREGDRLLGVDGSPRTVLRLSRGVGEMFEITPIRGGKPFVVNGDHVLSLMTTNEGKRFACCTTGKTIDNITVNEYLRKPKSWKHLRKLYRSSGVSFDCSREPEIDPYFLGVLLGDGSTQWSIGVTTADSEIEDCVRNEAARWGLFVTVSTKTNNKARSLYLTTRPGARNTLLRMVRSLGIDVECGQKFVPDHYKRGSVSTRRAVLAGLMDTDGHSHLGGFDFVSKSRTLADDVSYIARSLGLAAHVVECRKGCQTGAVGTYWRVSISGDCSIIPVRLARKIPKPRKMKKRPTVTGFSVKPVGRGEFFGFTLDGDHLYHLDDFTITHNSGKSLTMAGFIKDAIAAFPDTRVLVATHRKELIEQDASAIRKLWPDAPVGIYSAGLHSRQVRRITVAGVQTVHKKAAELGHVSLLLIDEAHLTPFAGDGMYRRLIRDLTETNPSLKIVGFTATPYRLSGGLLTRGAGHIFTSIAYRIPVQRLVDEGWLSPLVSPSTSTTYNTDGVGTVNGDFAVGELQSSIDHQEAVTRAALAESLELAKDRRAGIVFCVSVAHATLTAAILQDQGETAAMITGDTDDLTRSSMLSKFKRGEVRWLVGVDVLTTGFDAPITDVIVILRPTQSAGLYVQVCGRGMRLHDGKANCLVLDYGGNVERHGPITDIRHKSLAAGESKMVKECPNCMAEVKISKRECPECGFIFPEQPRDIDHDKTASRKAIMGPAPEPVWIDIGDVRASEWIKRPKEGEEPKPPTVCVEYLRGGRAVVKEWLCPEHGGYAAQKFCRWWFDAGGDLPAPHTVALALERIEAGELKRIEAVQVGKDGQYDRVLARRFSDAVTAAPILTPGDDGGFLPF